MDTLVIRERLTHTGYELFIFGLSALSLVNVFLVWFGDADTRGVVQIIDGLLCIVFLLDFGWRLATAPNRRAYLRWGWADLLGSLPFPPGIRFFRLIRMNAVTRLVREAGGRKVIHALLREPGETAIFLVFLVSITVLEISSILVLQVERGAPGSNIETGGDALWWSWVSVTTVGYGDKYPVTQWGRIFGTILLGVGIGLFSTITGFLATKLVVKGPEATPTETPAATSTRRVWKRRHAVRIVRRPRPPTRD